jgi:hypothetical protein
MASQTVNLRKLILPSKPGWCFVDADWAQVENRIGAILTGETFLLDAFARGDDIYKKVYSEMFKIPLETVTKSQRQIGKSLVLGQNYDMTYVGLSESLKCSEAEAKEYERQYKAAHPQTQRAKASLMEFCRKNGYVKTHYGRKRYINDINSPERFLRSAAEREVWNTYIQGTALDILKIALIRLYEMFKKEGITSQARIVLPVHDEILVQMDAEQMDPWEIYLLVKKSMEIDLKGYNLPVEGEFGWSFGSLTKNFEAFVDNSPEKYKKLFLNSSYFSREEEPASEVHEDIEEVVTVPEVSEPVNSDPISLVESDFQLPAFVVYLGADDTLSSSFVLSLSDYKADSGFCLYFVVSKKETFKLPYFVRGEVKTLLDTLPGKYDLLHD